MKDKTKFTFLLLFVSTITYSMQNIENRRKNDFPTHIEALVELTDKSIGCSEDLTDRAVKYPKEKDFQIQNKIKNGTEDKKGVAGFLATSHQKYPNESDRPAWFATIDPECKPFAKECNDFLDFTSNKKLKPYMFWTHCSHLSKATNPLTSKEQALLDFAYEAAEMEANGSIGAVE